MQQCQRGSGFETAKITKVFESEVLGPLSQANHRHNLELIRDTS